MKPITVRPSRSERKSCLCQFIIITAITLCSLGFLGTIAGIIYLEAFENRNLTSYETSEVPVDFSGLALDSRVDEESHTHDYQAEKTKPIDGVASIEKNKVSVVSSNENKQEGTIGVVRSATELNQYLNDANTKIKFQDGQTVIYEVKSDNPVLDYEKSSNAFENFRGRMLENFNIENNGSTENDQHENVTDESTEDKNSGLKSLNSTVSEKPNEDSINSVSQELEPAFESPVKSTLPKISETVNQLNLSKISPVVEPGLSNVVELIGPNPETNSLHIENKIESISMVDNEINTVEKEQISQLQLEDKALVSVPSVDTSKQASDEHNVDSMIMEVEDKEDAESSISRIGDLLPSENANAGPATTVEDNGNQHTKEKESHISSQVITEPTLTKSTVDMMVSLAEAMKHLQGLDVNNKIPSARSKTVKSKTQNTKKRKQSKNQQNDDAKERMKYLQKVRLLLFEHLQ